jgi:MYXO-CTERM domain-containing protein
VDADPGARVASARAMLRIISSLSILCVLVTNAQANVVDDAPVVGGSRVPLGKWRDVVAVLARDASCTGTLVAPDVVLTAGHCIGVDPVEVVVDTVDYAELGGDHIPVKWARAYPGWEDRYDVGVVMLDHVAHPTPSPVAASCTMRADLVDGAPLHLVGFGLTSPRGTDDNTALREAVLHVTDPTCTLDGACNAAIAPQGEFIAGGDGVDACFGDSGGPVFLDTPAGPVLAGVVSRGLARPGTPCGNGGVYVRADKVAAWVHSITGARLVRSTCTGAGDGDAGDADADAGDDTGGCSASHGRPTGAGTGALAAMAIAMVALRRRRAARRQRAAVTAIEPPIDTPIGAMLVGALPIGPIGPVPTAVVPTTTLAA